MAWTTTCRAATSTSHMGFSLAVEFVDNRVGNRSKAPSTLTYWTSPSRSPSASGPDRIGTAEHVQKVNAACSRTACRSPNRDEEYGPGLHSLTKATNMNLKSKGIEIY